MLIQITSGSGVDAMWIGYALDFSRLMWTLMNRIGYTFNANH